MDLPHSEESDWSPLFLFESSEVEKTTLAVQDPLAIPPSHATLEDLLELLTCSICMELMERPVSLVSCGHSGCHGCAVRWIATSPTGQAECWICRVPAVALLPHPTLRAMVDVCKDKGDQQTIRAEEMQDMVLEHESEASRRLTVNRRTEAASLREQLEELSQRHANLTHSAQRGVAPSVRTPMRDRFRFAVGPLPVSPTGPPLSINHFQESRAVAGSDAVAESMPSPRPSRLAAPPRVHTPRPDMMFNPMRRILRARASAVSPPESPEMAGFPDSPISPVRRPETPIPSRAPVRGVPRAPVRPAPVAAARPVAAAPARARSLVQPRWRN